MKKSIFVIFFLILIMGVVNATSNITLIDKSINYIRWNWSNNLSVKNISINGEKIIDYDLYSGYIATNLEPDTNYELKLLDINNTVLDSNITKTDATRETAQEEFFSLINTYLLLLIGIICCVVGVFVPFVGLIAVLIGISGLVASFNVSFIFGVMFFFLILSGLMEGIISLL